jgi:L-aspartate oxidase
LIVGGGIAGLSTALSLDPKIQVTIVTKTGITHSNTFDAQGGIAVSVGEDDSLEEHLKDTLTAGRGLCDEEAVKKIVGGSHEALERLLSWGANFDANAQAFDLGLEGGHSRHRILHAEGARTGKEILRCLLKETLSRDNIRILENHFLMNLITEDNKVLGALARNDNGQTFIFRSSKIVMAAGGAGQVYRETSNPPVATGDGVALGLRAGAVLMDMEFVQFHPTTLYIAGAARMLISEAVRGQGAYLVDINGFRFMQDRHEMAELAPRDVVSRAVLETIKSTRDTQVYLDVRHLKDFAEKFPFLHKTCLEFGVNCSSDLIPVCPSAHYHVGGIKTDLHGQSSVEGLRVAGESAATGFHGANRLASNSLLEGLVMGHEVAKAINEEKLDLPVGPLPLPVMGQRPFRVDLADMKRSLKFLMWREVGIVRNGSGLRSAQAQVKAWQDILTDRDMQEVDQWELYNMVQVASCIIDAALQREESRGVHYRSDFPEPDDKWQRHLEI